MSAAIGRAAQRLLNTSKTRWQGRISFTPELHPKRLLHDRALKKTLSSGVSVLAKSGHGLRYMSSDSDKKAVDFDLLSDDQLDKLSPKDLKDVIYSLKEERAKLSARQDEPVPSKITGAPQEYVPKPTKGEASDFKNITIVELQRMRDENLPITMVTAYDFPSAVHVDLAGIDVVLVGDSVGMVVLGYETTLPVSFEEILHHCRAVSRGSKRPLLVGDMPFGTYEISEQQALHNAYRLIKEGGMEAIKLEGADTQRLKTMETLVKGGVAVMGHIGLTPQSYSTLGGFRAQGRKAAQAVELIEKAKAVEEAGAFAVVVECVPEQVAQELTNAISIPTIGIGAGGHTSGQVLVYHDLLGMMQHPHHAKVSPKFCKQYSSVGVSINEALKQYVAEVRSREFPGAQFSPYKMAKGELEQFKAEVAKAEVHKGAAF